MFGKLTELHELKRFELMTHSINLNLPLNLLLIPTVLLSGILYWDTFSDLIVSWNKYEEYSHGYFLPIIAGYLIWQKRDQLENSSLFSPSWWGTTFSVAALVLLLIGIASHTAYAEKISFLLLLVGFFIARYGFRVMRILFVPATLIFLSFPLPFFINAQLTSGMQLISSELGVAIIRLFSVPVFLEGNIIDLGVYKLQVVEACSGLRYMYPLLSLSLILAYFFKVTLWKRVLIFLSAIPITIVMNSVRIGIIGVLVEYKGIGMAEGFLHDFEGWIIFLVCFIFLYLEMWLITFKERRLSKFSNLLAPR